MARHERKSTRLRGYDYAEPNRYFVTFCTSHRVCSFGEVVDGTVRLSTVGQIARDLWNAIPDHDHNVEVDICQVMPNHLHGILEIRWKKSGPCAGTLHAEDPRRSARATSFDDRHLMEHLSQRSMSSISPKAGSLSTILRSFKSAVTKKVHEECPTQIGPVWQSRFYDRIIRSDLEYFRIERYIRLNPILWSLDIDNRNAHLPSLEKLRSELRETHHLDDGDIEYVLRHEDLYREWSESRDT